MSYRASRDFVLSALHTIDTAPTLKELRASLVLKGSVALNLLYGSDRLSRQDMDFGLTSKDHRRLTQDDSDNLLAEMNEAWGARADGDSSIVVKGESYDTPWIAFVHPLTREPARIKIQTSGLQVPPVLGVEMPTRPFRTYDGKTFRFPVLQVSEIAAEKMCRLWRPDKYPPRVVDIYDIGFCAEQSDYDLAAVVKVVRSHRKGREKNLIKISEAHPAVRIEAKKPSIANDAQRLALFGPGATADQITKRVAAGLAQVEAVRAALEGKGGR